MTNSDQYSLCINCTTLLRSDKSSIYNNLQTNVFYLLVLKSKGLVVLNEHNPNYDHHVIFRYVNKFDMTSKCKASRHGNIM